MLPICELRSGEHIPVEAQSAAIRAQAIDFRSVARASWA
jgi:hypothetical protein